MITNCSLTKYFINKYFKLTNIFQPNKIEALRLNKI